VLEQGRIARGRYFVVRALPSECGGARLGIIAARKALRRAVDRNSCKRLVRETFRRYESELAGLDIVVVCRMPILGKEHRRARLELSDLLPSFARPGNPHGDTRATLKINDKNPPAG
jgi:ribonuclease P protein component